MQITPARNQILILTLSFAVFDDLGDPLTGDIAGGSRLVDSGCRRTGFLDSADSSSSIPFACMFQMP